MVTLFLDNAPFPSRDLTIIYDTKVVSMLIYRANLFIHLLILNYFFFFFHTKNDPE